MDHFDRNTGCSLTPEQVDFFGRNGYLVVDRLTSASELTAIKQEVVRLFERRAGREVGDQFDLASADQEDTRPLLSQIMYPAKYAPALLDSTLLENATAIAQQLLGSDFECCFEHAILKPAGFGAPTPWHQDAAYWSPNVTHHTISVWVALQETTVENGCLHYVPCSHQGDVLPHQPIGNDPHTHGLELTAEEMHRVTNVVACPLKPGQATIHGGYTLHSAGPNTTDQDRIGLVVFGKRAPTPRTLRYDFPWQEVRRTAREARANAAEKKN